MLLSREDILGADDRQTVDVPVPEWGGTVRVRGMSGLERDEYEASMILVARDGSRSMNMENLRARLVAFSCIDDEGKRVFTVDDVATLGDKSAAALNRVFDVARKLSGLTTEDVEELAEGFGGAPNDGSTSG